MKTLFARLVAITGLSVLMAGCVSGIGGAGSRDSYRFIKTVSLPQGGVVTVAEGDFEPRSVGSYSVRLYGGDCREYPYDDFQDGLIRARPNGIVEEVIVKDLDGDKLAEVLVSMRSVGTGNARSVDAYRIIGKKIRPAGSVVNLNPKSDAIKLLAFKLNPADVGTAQWFQAIEEALHICDADGHGPTPGSAEWMSAVDMKVLPGQAATSEALVVGTKKWMDVVHMIVFR